MKNRILYILGIVMALPFFQSCYEDEGNYDYTELPTIGIEGVESMYEKRRLMDSLNISVTVNTEFDANDLKYTWFIYNTGDVNYIDAVQVDTISREKDLKYLVAEEPGNYILTLKVENTVNRYAVYKSATVSVGSEFSQGVYILKETADGNTDLDFCSESQEMARDIFAMMKGGTLRGKPQILSQMMAHPYIEPVTMNRTYGIALGITTTEDLCMLRTSDLATIHTGETMFYGGFNTTPIRLAHGSKYGVYFSKEGIYTMSVETNGSGMLGVPKFEDASVKWIALDKQHQAYLTFICFDDKNGRFLSTNVTTGAVSAYNDSDGITDKCLYMGMCYHSSMKNTAYAVFEAADGSRKLYRLKCQLASSNSPIKEIIDVDSDSKLSKATAFSVCAFNAPVMYFLSEGKVYYYSFQDGSEREIQLSGIGAGETVNYVANKWWSSYYLYNKKDHLVVGTTTGNNDYKLYFYEINGGTPTGDPVSVVSGTGKVADVQYMESRWGQNTNQEFKYQASSSYTMGLSY